VALLAQTRKKKVAGHQSQVQERQVIRLERNAAIPPLAASQIGEATVPAPGGRAQLVCDAASGGIESV
jgi:hypothetical protein